MIDDPLSLLSLGIWLMAAGMWPVGFLFGACSACCNPCLGGFCHFHQFKGSECRSTTDYPNLSRTVSIDTVSTNDAVEADTNFVLIGDVVVSISGDKDGEPYTITTIFYQYIITTEADVGCNIDTECRHFIQFLAYADTLFTPTYFESNRLLLFTSGECAPLTLDVDFDDVVWTLKFGNADSIWTNMQAYLETLTPNVLLSYDACECGACCSPGGEGCTDDVAEHLCDTNNDFVWAGVGTACDDDPNPCEEE
jgi:hypothetical protein